MKLRTKIKMLAVPAATLGLVAAPIFTATSCSQDYERLFFTVTNESGLEVEFCDIGASIANMKWGSTYLTYHQKDRATFTNTKGDTYFHGKILGRVAGRFKDGKFKINDTSYQVPVNEKSATKNNCLHGGKDGLEFKKFKHEVGTDDSGNTTVTFKYTSPDGEAGFPGKVDVTAIYTVYKSENRIDTELLAVPDKETVLNLSTHSLFRLGNDGDVLNYELRIPAANRIEYDNESIGKTGQVPIGLKDVTKDAGIYNFQKNKKIGEDIYASAVRDPVSNGYDHIWYVGDVAEYANRYVNLYNPKNKLNLKVTAMDPNVTGFILYSNDYPNANWTMSDGQKDTQYAGITIEPYTYFTDEYMNPIIYSPTKTFRTKYSYEFTIGQK